MADRWTWNFDVYDESDSPTEEGYYRIIDDEGYEMTDYFFGEPRMTPRGIGYWRDGTRPIIAWKRAEQTEPITSGVIWTEEAIKDELTYHSTCASTEPSTDCGWK